MPSFVGYEYVWQGLSQPWAAPKKPILNRVNIYNDPIFIALQ